MSLCIKITFVIPSVFVGLFHEFYVSCLLENNNLVTIRCLFCERLFFLFEKPTSSAIRSERENQNQ